MSKPKAWRRCNLLALAVGLAWAGSACLDPPSRADLPPATAPGWLGAGEVGDVITDADPYKPPLPDTCATHGGCPPLTACIAKKCVPSKACQLPADCTAVQAVCDAGLGVCVECTADTDCPGQATCYDKVCQAPLPSCVITWDCPPGSVCTAKGANDTAKECTACDHSRPCSLGLDCVKGQCLPAPCNGGAICHGNAVAECIGSKYWQSYPCTGWNTTCAVVNGKAGCHDIVCEPGKSKCTGGSIQSCLPSGLGWTDPKPCEGDKVCWQSKCTAPECVPGQIGCIGNLQMYCNISGMWASKTECDLGLTCSAGECAVVVCAPNSNWCEGQVVMSCDATGVSSAATVDCDASGQVCVDGACKPGSKVCSPGATECSGNDLQTCSASGLWWKPSSCEDGNPCTTNSCQGGKCVAAPGKDGTPCTDLQPGATLAGACPVLACQAGQCKPKANGLWQTAFSYESTTTDVQAGIALPGGETQWFGKVTPKVSGTIGSAVWMGRLNPGGQFAANALVPGITAPATLAGSATGTWLASLQSADLVDSNGKVLAERSLGDWTCTSIGKPCFSWPEVKKIAGDSQGGVVAWVAGFTSRGGPFGQGPSDGQPPYLIRLDSAGKTLWKKWPSCWVYNDPDNEPIWLEILPKSDRTRLITHDYESAVWREFSPGGDCILTATVKPKDAVAWEPTMVAALPADAVGADHRVLAGKAQHSCSSCFPAQQMLVARLGPNAKILWHQWVPWPGNGGNWPYALWESDGSVVVVSAHDENGKAGWRWIRLRASDGELQSNKAHFAKGDDYWLRALRSGSGGVIAMRQVVPDQPYAEKPWIAYRTDPWGNSDCASSGLCAGMNPKACDDGNPCTLDDCSGGKCSHGPAPDGVLCGKGTCKKGACSGN